MNLFEAVVDLVKEKDLFGDWPAMFHIFERAARREPQGWDIVFLACLSVGGTIEQAVPAVAALGCQQIAIIIIDDLLDEDPRGVHNEIGTARAANLASAFQAAGMRGGIEGGYPNAGTLAGGERIAHVIVRTALGQELDVQIPDSEEDYWHVVRSKSSPYWETALYTGAMLGGASFEVGERLRQLGEIYGELLQIHDDLKDTLADPASPDWIQRRITLPILFAEVVDHPDRARFLELRGNIGDPDALREAQTILVRCGAISYCLDQLISRCQIARNHLSSIDLVDSAWLEKLIEDMVEPARQMIQTLGCADGEEEFQALQVK